MEVEAVIRQIVNGLYGKALLRTKAGRVLNAFYYGALAAGVYMALARFSGLVNFEFWDFTAILLVSLLVGFLRAAPARPDKMLLMAETDRRFALRERLSTAYELLETGRDSSLKGLLMRDAASHARRVDLFSYKPGPRLKWRLRHSLLTAAFIALAVLPGGMRGDGTYPGSPPHLREAGIALETGSGALEGKSPSGDHPPPGEVRGQSAQGTLSTGIEGSGGAREGMGGETVAPLALRERTPFFREEGQGLPEVRDLSDEDLFKITEGMIESRPWTLDPKQMDELGEALKSGEATALRELLERLFAQGEESSGAQDPGFAGAWEVPDEGAGPSARSESGESLGAENAPGTLALWGASSGIESMFEDLGEEGGESGLTTGKLPGKEQGPEVGAASALPGGSTRKVIRVRGRMDKGETLRGIVKALPVLNPSEVELEEVVARYSYQVEGLMERYDLPPHYMEYVKRYFLAIGLGEGGEEK